MDWREITSSSIEAVKALTPLAWPLLAVFAIYKFFPQLEKILSKNEGKIEFGSFELSYGEAADRINSQIKDLQDQVIKLEKIMSGNYGEEEDRQEKANITESKFSILWVDDYPSNNALIIDRFQNQSIDIKISISTEDAMLKFDSESYNLIITDLGRYENGVEHPLAGLELTEAVRLTDKKVPILVFAGKRGLDNRDKLIAAGATDVTASATQVIEFVEKLRAKKLAAT